MMGGEDRLRPRARTARPSKSAARRAAASDRAPGDPASGAPMAAARGERAERTATPAFALAVLEAVPGALVVLDADGRIVRSTQLFRAMFQLEDVETEGRPLDQLPGWGPRGGRFRHRLQQAAENHEVLEWEGEFGAAGRKLLAIAAGQIDAADPGSTVMVLHIEDMTARRQREAQARLRAEQLRTAEKATFAARMAAALAHELNNPLEAITNLVYATQQMPELPAPAREYLSRASQELARVARLTRDARGLFREGPEAETVALPAMFRDLLAVFATHLRNRGIQVETTGPRGTAVDDTGPVVRGVPGEIRRVFTNVLANAVDATPPGGVIRIRMRPCAPAGGGQPEGILVLVSDPGPGLAVADRERIFRPLFTNGESTDARLGLALAKEVTDKYRGWIKLRSRRLAAQAGAAGRGGMARGGGGGRTGTVVGVFLPAQAEPGAAGAGRGTAAAMHG